MLMGRYHEQIGRRSQQGLLRTLTHQGSFDPQLLVSVSRLSWQLILDRFLELGRRSSTQAADMGCCDLSQSQCHAVCFRRHDDIWWQTVSQFLSCEFRTSRFCPQAEAPLTADLALVHFQVPGLQGYSCKVSWGRDCGGTWHWISLDESSMLALIMSNVWSFLLKVQQVDFVSRLTCARSSHSSMQQLQFSCCKQLLKDDQFECSAFAVLILFLCSKNLRESALSARQTLSTPERQSVITFTLLVSGSFRKYTAKQDFCCNFKNFTVM